MTIIVQPKMRITFRFSFSFELFQLDLKNCLVHEAFELKAVHDSLKQLHFGITLCFSDMCLTVLRSAGGDGEADGREGGGAAAGAEGER